MADDSPDEPVEAGLEGGLSPGPPWVGVEATGQREKRQHEAEGDEHEAGPQ